MANNYYTRTFAFAERTKARGEEVRGEFDSLVSGMDGVENDTNRSIKMPDGASVELPTVPADRSLMVIGFDVGGNVEVQAGVGAWRGDWVTATDYKIRDIMKDSGGALGQDNVYICNANHTSSALLATDTVNWDLMIDVTDAVVAQAAAAASAAAALVSEGLSDADATQTALDRIETGLDTISTAADVVTTNADAVSTGNDLTATNADALITNADAIQTSADRIQTGLDATVTAADAVSTAANAVSTAADAVSTNADAISAANDLVQTNIDQISCDADATQVAADLVQTNIDQIATAADRVQTGLDVLSTNADVVTTNADVLLTNAKFSEFNRLYLGSKAVAPALDNDGDPLEDGAMYFDTGINFLRVYDLGNTVWVTIPSTTLASLTDVVLTSLSAGELLMWDGTNFINQTLTELDIVQLSGINGTAFMPSGTTAQRNDQVGIRYNTTLSAFEGYDGTQWGSIDGRFVSTEQTITSAGSLVLAHGLGVEPFIVQSNLICKVAEHGYSIGDKVIVHSTTFSGSVSNSFGMSLVADSSNINIRLGSDNHVFFVNHKVTGVSTSLANANWNLIIKAIA